MRFQAREWTVTLSVRERRLHPSTFDATAVPPEVVIRRLAADCYVVESTNTFTGARVRLSRVARWDEIAAADDVNEVHRFATWDAAVGAAVRGERKTPAPSTKGPRRTASRSGDGAESGAAAAA